MSAPPPPSSSPPPASRPEPGPLGDTPPPGPWIRHGRQVERLRWMHDNRRRWRGRPGAPGPRPEWWPAEETWPPTNQARPWNGFGCLFGLVFITGVLGILAIATRFIGDVLDAPGLPGALIRFAALGVLIAIVAGLARAGMAIRGTGSVLDDLVDKAARVEAGDYTARVALTRPAPEPVANLTRGFNTMAARLEANEVQRRSLLADVTHELRTPLAVVQGNVEAILDGVHPADEPHLTAILDETRVLGRLIEDLRTLALSEAGSLSLHLEPTDLEVLVTDVAAAFGPAAEAAGVALETDVAADVPLLDVDPVRIREVIGNLVGNALRHTPAGGRISMTGRRVAAVPGSGDRADVVEVVVRDTGSGIDPELLPHVFERFARGSGSSGTGLGLSIARGLVELHGGTIDAASPAGGGTVMRIRLPIRPA